MGWGLFTLCQTQSTDGLGMSISRLCFTKSDIFFSVSSEPWGEGRAYKLAASIRLIKFDM